MEGLARLVSESLARHGFETPLDHRRLQWSKWFRCESSFTLLLVPGQPGIFALGEEVVAPGELPSAGGKRMLALFQIAEADDLAAALGRLFLPGHPERERFASGRCFARYSVIEDAFQRKTAYNAFQQWLTTSSEAASGIFGTLQSAPFMGGNSQAVEIEGGEHHSEVEAPTSLPSGF